MKVKVKMDRIHLWCCDKVLIKPFPAKYVWVCPDCGAKKPCQSRGLL